MTDAPAAILATFSDLRLVKSRKAAQLVFEVPMEKLKEALDALGMPDPQGDVWCGIARVHANKQNFAMADGMPIEGKFMGDAPTREDGVAVTRAQSSPTSDYEVVGKAVVDGLNIPLLAHTKPRLPASQRAALLVKDAEFIGYLQHVRASFVESGRINAISNAEAANKWLKERCGINSKSELLPGTAAHWKFVEIEGNFRAWRQAKQLGAA